MASSARHLPTIEQAIIPAAGLGTRLRPLTLALPKEMLPLGRLPVLEHVLLELASSGIRRAAIVVSTQKPAIERYFGRGDLLGVRLDYIVQPEMRGLADAVVRAAPWCEGVPALVAFGDTVVEQPLEGATARLLRTFQAGVWDAAVLAERVTPEQTRRYGILAPAAAEVDGSAPFGVVGVVEKPGPGEAPSCWAVAARYVVGPALMKALRAVLHGARGEVGITEGVRLLLASGGSVVALPLVRGERRLDIGGWDTYLVAAARYAARDPEHGAAVREAVLAEKGDA
ncbi:MAG TPA: sugar phosphate nucleotidyltransferase [Chthonomonadales bacterium]|nr:sugar phosphate nucleotidyltransferase [Chthonomonadales bacterium]